MSTEAITPLRQRIIEDMNSRKLGAHTQRSHSTAASGSLHSRASPDTLP